MPSRYSLRSRRDPLGIVGVALLLAVWAFVSPQLGSARLPPPWEVARTLWTSFTWIPEMEFVGQVNQGMGFHLFYTVWRTLLGAALGMATGIIAGVIMGRSLVIRSLFEVPINLARVTPSLVAVPFLLMWVGPVAAVQIGLIAIYCFFNLVTYTLNAIQHLNPISYQFARTLGASPQGAFRTVVLPAIVPELVGGIRVTLALAWGFTVVAELLGIKYGVGMVFHVMLQWFGTDVILAGIIWITLVAVASDQLLGLLLRRWTRWAPE